MDYEWQAPNPKIEIFSYKKPESPVLVLVPKENVSPGFCNGLISYSFSESTSSIEGGFTFTIQEDPDGSGYTAYDRIRNMFVVKIYEGSDRTPSFVGVIHKKRVGKNLTDKGVRNTTSFSGESIAGLFTRFQIAMNIRIMSVKDADAANTNLTQKLSGMTLNPKSFLENTWEDYTAMTISGLEGEVALSNTKVVEIIANFMGSDFLETSATDADFAYPIASAFYQQGVNIITGIWQSILPPPVYEIFSRVDKAGKCKIVVRESPFDSDDLTLNDINFSAKWTGLRLTEVEPVKLTSFDLELSDEEVYTAYYSYLEGSVLSSESYVTLSQLSKSGEQTVCIDSEKLAVYGYRPLEVNFRGYARVGTDSTRNNDVLKAFSALNLRLKEWYGNIDKMHAGSITLTTDFMKPEKNPRAGERLGFIGGQFYIKSTDHSWAYGGTPTIACTVNRGAKYSKSGVFVGEIENAGKTLIELEGVKSV